jgi:two-component system sensor histidine kinase VicK
VSQVIQNLVGNALKFTPQGGLVTVSVCAGTGFIELRVSDTGIGIPEGSMKQIFDSFYQVDSSPTRQYGGSGLGLAFVREIVHAHGGKVFVKSGLGAGSTFLILLPPDAGPLDPQ